ncbi:MAG: ATP-binding protein [Bacteroidota bacterium]
MGFVGITLLTCAVGMVFIAYRILGMDFKNRLYRASFLLCMVFAVGRFSEFMILQSQTLEQALIYRRWYGVWFMAAALSPLCFWYFARMGEIVTNRRIQRLIMAFIFLPAIIFMGIEFSGVNTYGTLRQGENGQFVFTIPGRDWFTWVRAIWFPAVSFLMTIFTWVAFQKAEKEKERLWKGFLFLTTIIAIVESVSTHVVYPMLDLSTSPLRTAIPLTLGSLIYAWAFTDFRLFEVNHDKAIADIVASVSNMLVLVDMELNIKQFNNASLEILGMEGKDLQDQSIAMLFNTQDWTSTVRELKELQLKGQRHTRTYTLSQGERTCHLSITISPIFSGRRQIGFIFVGTDLTQFHQHQDQLERYAKKLERSNQELERFAHIASHDLKEPLRSVCSFIMLLERKLRPTLDPEARAYIQYATDGAKQMNELIEDVLEFSRLDKAGQIHAPVDLNEVMDQVNRNLFSLINDKGARLVYNELPTLSGEEGQFLRLFQNLVENGLKFNEAIMPEVVVNYDFEAGYHHFQFIDNGIGVKPGFEEKVFEMFQRLHNREAYTGSGMGLSICKKIVDRYEGQITVSRNEVSGSTFEIKIPEAMAA